MSLPSSRTRARQYLAQRPMLSLMLIAGGVAGLVTMVSFGSFTHFLTSNRLFCLSTCHGNQRDTFLWRESTVHPPSVNCAACHNPHNALVPLTFTARVSGTSIRCLDCHPKLAEEEITSYKHNAMRITLPHRLHAQELAIPCSLCHYNVEHDRRAAPTNRPPMTVCRQCHSREEMFCTSCHPDGTLELPLTDRIIEYECGKCHVGFEMSEHEIHDLDFLHEPHLENDVACDECHDNSNRHGEITVAPEDCEGCHG